MKKTKKEEFISIKVDLSPEEAEELDSLKRELHLSDKDLFMELIRFKRSVLKKRNTTKLTNQGSKKVMKLKRFQLN